jgi:Tfp pilus assembly protein PilE
MNERGLSLVEVTIILMVMAVLTAVVAPAAGSYIEGARHVKAKVDIEAIGGAIEQVLHSTGLPCLSLNGTSCANAVTGQVELLVSGSAVGSNEPTVSTAAFTAPASAASSTSLNWAGGASEVADARRDVMDDQFVTNAPAYPSVSFTAAGGPRPGVGWRGPYLSGPLDVDPWGYAYQASTLFLSVASNAADGTGAGQLRGGWTSNVVVISGGSNGVIQTAFGSGTTTAVGDDVVYVVQGATH